MNEEEKGLFASCYTVGRWNSRPGDPVTQRQSTKVKMAQFEWRLSSSFSGVTDAHDDPAAARW